MAYSNNLHILIADHADADRQMMADILGMRGFNVTQAIDGGTAIKVVEEHNIDLAIIAHQMSPKTGFDFARHVVVNGHDVAMILIADDLSTDLLREAGKFEIQQVMRKPIDPDRLTTTVRRVLRARGKNPDVISSRGEPVFTPEDLMSRAIALAHQNARSRTGGPFGAIVADAQGRILGEGVNGVTFRCDPTAHAEVLAIRRAAEKLNKTDLSGCVVYCSSEPTMLGQALIMSTGIKKVYYGLSHEEIGATRINEAGILGEIRKPLSQREIPYEQLQHGEALKMFKSWKKQKNGVAD